LQIGTIANLSADDPDSTLETAELAEKLGYDEIWVGDHVVQPVDPTTNYLYQKRGPTGVGHGFHDPFVSLMAIAARTSKARIGLSVLIVPYRNPVITAKMLTSVDVLSHGRLDVGIGSGWLKEEFEALESPYDERGGRTDEYLTIYKKLWTEDVISFEGRYYRINPLAFNPKPVQKPYPPIWVGGNTQVALRRLVQHGDVWQPINVSAAQMPDYIDRIKALCEKWKRDFSELKIAVNRGVLIVDDPAKIRRGDPDWPYHPMITTPDEIIEEFRRYRELGIYQVHCHFVTRNETAQREVLHRFAEELRPEIER
jgi:probable F420-dependent oxidoreductase